MRKETKQRIVCAFLLATGLSLCIGGIFLPPLLIAGVPLFAGGLSLLSALIEDNDKIAINTTINNYKRNREGEEYVERATVRARYTLGSKSKLKLGSFATKIRDMFNRMPSDFKTAEPAVISFSHVSHNNYHTAQSSPHSDSPSPVDESMSDDSSSCSSDNSQDSHHLDII